MSQHKCWFNSYVQTVATADGVQIGSTKVVTRGK